MKGSMHRVCRSLHGENSLRSRSQAHYRDHSSMNASHHLGHNQLDAILEASRRRDDLQSRGMTRGMTAPASSSMWGSEAMKRWDRNSNATTDSDGSRSSTTRQHQHLHTSYSMNAMNASGVTGEYSFDTGRQRETCVSAQEVHGILRSHFSDLESRGTSTPFICRGWHGYQRTNLDMRQASRRKQRIGYGGAGERAGRSTARMEYEQSEFDLDPWPKSPSTSRLIDDASVPFLHEFELPTSFGRDLEMLRAIKGGKKVLSPRFQ